MAKPSLSAAAKPKVKENSESSEGTEDMREEDIRQLKVRIMLS